MDFYSTGRNLLFIGKNVLIIMVPILTNKGVFESSYNDLKSRDIIKKQRYYFAKKGLSSQGYGFSSSHVWVSELDYKES